MLAVRRFGSGAPVVALHGFTLTGEQFATADSWIRRTVVAPDLPGHGESRHAPTPIDEVVDEVAEVVNSVGEAVPLVGYSQGGRIALMNAVRNPDDISALVLLSTTAGIEDDDQRGARAADDARLAATILSTELDDFLDSWTSKGITSTSYLTNAESLADRKLRSENSTSGLADALIGYGQGAQAPVWDSLNALTMPVLIMTGSRDRKYCDIAERMASRIPHAESLVVKGAGHNPLLEAPEVAYAAISDFLDRHS